LCANSDPTFSNVTVTENVALNGGGIYIGGISSVILNKVIISENFADGNMDQSFTYGFGGGIYTNADSYLINVSIVGNKATGNTGGMSCKYWSYPVLINTIIWNNSLPNISYEKSPFQAGVPLTIGYSAIGGNETIKNEDYVNWLEGNIDSYPSFVDSLYGDYNLAEGSPCIDAGIQDTILVYNSGQDTVFIPLMTYLGSAPDMGAYEFDPASNLKREIKLPNQYSLYQNYPNPFNPHTRITFTLPKSEFVTLKIYNILGQEVSTMVSNRLNPGIHSYQFNGSNLASGVYYYQIETNAYRQVKKMILLQ
jgi:hypothetical protein